MSLRTALAASAALLLTPLALSAQSFQYTSVTKMEMGGALGRMMSMMPGMGGDMESTTSMKGSKVREDSKESSTIMDWSTGTFTVLDHKSKTYTTMSIKDMMDRMSESMGQMAEQKKANAPEADSVASQYDVHISTERTGKTEKIDGYSAEQVVVTMEMVPKEGVQQPQGQEGMSGNMGVVTELWMSKDFPGYQMMKEMGTQAAQAMRETAAQGAAASMAMLSAFDPRLPDAASRNAEELNKVEGEPLRTVMSFVIVQPGEKLDAQKVVAGDDKDLSGGEGGGGTSAADAAKKALGGLFGRGKKEQPKPAEEAESPTQVVLMRTTSEVQHVSTADLDDSLFAVPEGYTERKMQGMGGR